MHFLLAIVLASIIGFITIPKGLSQRIDCNSFKIIYYESTNFLKGLILVGILKFILQYEFELILSALIFGLTISSFLKGFNFKISYSHYFTFGGLLLIVPVIDLIWFIIWMLAFAYKRNLIFSYISSTMLTGLVGVTSSEILNNIYWYTWPVASTDLYFKILIGVLFSITLISQWEYISTYFDKTKS